MEGIHQGLGISRERVLKRNAEKLQQRYGDSYSDEAAVARKDKPQAVGRKDAGSLLNPAKETLKALLEIGSPGEIPVTGSDGKTYIVSAKPVR